MKSIREIAALSGVSIATVSRYVNKKETVSKKSAEKIQKVIDEHGYIPNKLTQAIMENDSKMIGLIVCDVINPFFPALLNEIGAKIDELGFTLVVCNTHGDVSTEENFITKLSEIRASGFIVVNSLNTDIYQNIKVPIVSVENKITNSSFVVSDNKDGAKQATLALINAKRKRLLYLSDEVLNEVAVVRKTKFTQVCLENKIQYEFLNKSIEKLVYQDICNFDGIFCWNDLTAHKVISILKTNNIAVGKDVSVVGFDNIEINKLFDYKLATIQQDLGEIGKACTKLLMDIINHQIYTDLIIETKFVIGDTV